MAETSSSGEETPPSTAGPSPEPPKESEGKKELEARTKAVEKALSPLIEQVSVQETLQQASNGYDGTEEVVLLHCCS